MKIVWLEDVELQIITNFDADEDHADTDNATFRKGEEHEVDIVAEADEAVTMQFGDGSVAFNVQKEWYAHEYTREEMREMLFDQIWSNIDYWDTVTPVGDSVTKTQRDRISGAVFSILVMLDGGSVGMPGFKLIPIPHSSDKDFHIGRGENWMPDNVDVGGALHEELNRHDPQKKPPVTVEPS